MADYLHSTGIEVRDTDCDVQGIVANHVYVEYFAHARHAFLKDLGYDLKALHEQGIDALVESITINYKSAALPYEKLSVHTGCHAKGMFRAIFPQQVTRDSDGSVVAEATVTCATITKDGPIEPTALMEAVAKFVDGKTK